jgi:hypothetical protein
VKNSKFILSVTTASLLLSSTLSAETGTGLDKIIEIIDTDSTLNSRVTGDAIEEAIYSADRMNSIILEAIFENGLANDKEISTSDAREINNFIYTNYSEEWKTLHGDDEDGVESGFHLVQNNGARTKLFGKNAINRVADSIYHLGFETHRKNRLLNEDDNKNASFKKVANWLNSLLIDDLESLSNSSVVEVTGSTNTGLDDIIEIIYTDVGLQKRVSTGDIREGAKSADEMNKILLEAIYATGVTNDGEIVADEIRELNSYLSTNYATEWAELHGDDEVGEETGFHLVQNDGAKRKLFGKNAINKIADGIYHLGFETQFKNRLSNEDGNKNASFKKVASWLNGLIFK